ncbi:MAG TPA: type II toxin-antitoxin system RelE/ParE family toxin [Rariglobus sp.]
MGVKIYRAAQSRLLEVWNYTEATWGEEQADAYVRELVEAAHRLPDERPGWRPVKDRVVRGVFLVRHRHHYLFFRELGGGEIGGINVLHEAMDIPARLREDAGV